MNNKAKTAFATMEVVIGILLSFAVFFVVLNMFGDNLSTLSAKTNLKNIFDKKTTKTDYESFNRDYASSQINVQVMGEQGSTSLRKDANNKALQILNGELTDTDANSVAYLATIIENLTGEPHICVKMEEDSNEHCDKVGGYTYEISTNDSTLNARPVRNNFKSKNHKIKQDLADALNIKKGKEIKKLIEEINQDFSKDLNIVFMIQDGEIDH